MKKQELQFLIREEIKNTLTEATKATMKTALTALMKSIKNSLKSEGVKVNKITPQELETIAAEWIMGTVDSGYIDETLPTDMDENDSIAKIVKKYRDEEDSNGDWDDFLKGR